MANNQTMTIVEMAAEAAITVSALRNARDSNPHIFPKAVSGHGRKECLYNRSDFLTWLNRKHAKRNGLNLELASKFLRGNL